MTREGWSVTYDAEEDVGVILHDNGVARADIEFQHGPVGDGGVNGVQSEEVLQLLIMRLTVLNKRQQCEENDQALRALNQAADWLAIRTSKRTAQGVEGTNKEHVS